MPRCRVRRFLSTNATTAATRAQPRRLLPLLDEAYVFGALDHRYVEHNFLLEGRRDQQIEKRSAVRDLDYGFVIRRGRWAFDYHIVSRSPEYFGDRHHRYGSVGPTVLSCHGRDRLPD